jgi:hypothetical protein
MPEYGILPKTESIKENVASEHPESASAQYLNRHEQRIWVANSSLTRSNFAATWSLVISLSVATRLPATRQMPARHGECICASWWQELRFAHFATI